MSNVNDGNQQSAPPFNPTIAQPIINVQYLGTKTLIAATSIPRGTDLIVTQGFGTPGDGGFGNYTPVSDGNGAGRIQSLDGAWWQYQADSRGANALAFGAVADGVYNAGTGEMTGTDNAPMIQECIDFAAYFGNCKPYVPGGTYRSTDTLQLGYGTTLIRPYLEGDGMSGTFQGTTILCDFSDRPGIAVSGAREASIKGLNLIGKNLYWIVSNNLMQPVPTVDDTDIANWIDPTLDPNADSQFTPYAAIVIDPYAGNAPSPAYPDVTFPLWLGSDTQYNKDPSSFVVIEGCLVEGFVAMAAIQPCDFDGSGDFIKFVRCQGAYCAYIILAGNGEGRECSTLDCTFSVFHTGIDNTLIGNQIGQLDLCSTNTDWERCIQLLNVVDAATSGSFIFNGGYSEDIWRIGTWSNNTANNQSLTFNSFNFDFTAQNDYRGYPPYCLTGGGPTFVEFNNCALVGFSKLLYIHMNQASVKFSGCSTDSGERTNAYEQIAHSFLAGSVMFPIQPSNDTNILLEFSNKDANTYDFTGSIGPKVFSRYSASKRDVPLCAWLDTARSFNDTFNKVDAPQFWTTYGKDVGYFSTLSIAGTTLTSVFGFAITDQQVYYAGALPGGVIVDQASGSVFYIRSRVTTTILSELQNNYRIVGGTFDANGMSTGGGTVTLFNAFDRSGYIFYGNSLFYTPIYYTEGALATNSAVLTSVCRGDGSFGWVTNQIDVNDYYYDNPSLNVVSPIYPEESKIVNVNGGANTLTISNNPQQALTHYQLKLFIRQPPANS